MLSDEFSPRRIPEKHERQEGVLRVVAVEAVIGRAGSS